MDGQLLDAVQRWRDAGVVDDETARDIRHFERGQHAAAELADDEPLDTGPLPDGNAGIVAEGIAYVGAAFAVGAGFALLEGPWNDWSGVVRVLVTLVATLAIGGGAAALGGTASASVQRLRSVLSAVAAVGLGLTVGVGLDAFASVDGASLVLFDGATIVLVGAATVLLAAVPVHLARPCWPSTLVLGGSLLTTVLAGAFVAGLDGDPTFDVTLVGLGLAWAALGWSGRLRPQRAVEITGLLVGGIGVQRLAFGGYVMPALLVGLVVSFATLAVGVTEQRTPPTVLGGLGIAVFAPQLVPLLLGDGLGGPLALFVGGLALVTTAIVVLRRRSRA